MKIAILGSVSSVIPPEGQAAIERLAYSQALGLAERGHSVLLFAPQGSKVPHENVTVVPVAQKVLLMGSGKEGSVKEEERYGASYKLRLEIVNLAQVLEALYHHKDNFDVILNNLRGEAVILPVANALGKPIYHVAHLPIFPELVDLFKKYNTRIISISDAQRKQVPDLNYRRTIYNSVDTDEFAYSPNADNYVLYVGSIGKNKNPKDAILTAKKAGCRLLIGGRIKDEVYYNEEIAPYIDGKTIVWIGEQHPKDIVALYQKAKALLFPTMWDEPFGLVMIEAMSCGTPVVAFGRGAVPEVVVDGKTGFIVEDDDNITNTTNNQISKWIIKKRGVEGLVEAVRRVGEIDRSACRGHVEEHFTIEKMVDSLEAALMKRGDGRA